MVIYNLPSRCTVRVWVMYIPHDIGRAAEYSLESSAIPCGALTVLRASSPQTPLPPTAAQLSSCSVVLGHEDRLVALPQRGAYLRRDVHRRAQPHEGQAADGPPREVDAARTLGIVFLLELARLRRWLGDLVTGSHAELRPWAYTIPYYHTPSPHLGAGQGRWSSLIQATSECDR